MDVKKLREETGLSQQELANETGIPKGRINAWEQRGNSPKVEDFNILEKFFKEYKSSLNTRTILKETTSDLIPLYDIRASAGGGFNNLSENVLDYIKAVQLKGCTAAIMVEGDSMNNVLKDKDIIGIKPIENIVNIEYGRIYAVLTKPPDSELFVKYIRRHSDKKILILKSENEKFDDMEMPKENIEFIWKQKGIIRH